MNNRTCIVTRQVREPEELIRFVAAPDGSVVADLARKLPGRGCWVTAERALVDKAVKKQLFARALKTDAKAAADLGAVVDGLLAKSLLGMMALARKAGQFVTGAVKVENAVRTGEAIAVFHATDAAEDGIRKIGQARHFVREMSEGEADIAAFKLFDADEMASTTGGTTFMHAAALAGQAGEGVVKRAILLERYRCGVRAHEAS